jgi:hypothetical protein
MKLVRQHARRSVITTGRIEDVYHKAIQKAQIGAGRIEAGYKGLIAKLGDDKNTADSRQAGCDQLRRMVEQTWRQIP